MKLTSAEANKLIKQLRDEIALIEAQEKNAYRFVAATIEDKEEVRPNYSFAEIAAALDEREEKIRRIKHALNVFNATTKPDGVDMTIDELLVWLPQVRDRLRRLAVMLSEPEKERVSNSGRTSIIEYEYANYDYDEVRLAFETLTEMKNKALTALDVANNTLRFDAEI